MSSYEKISHFILTGRLRCKSFDDVRIALAMDYDGLRLQLYVLAAGL